MRKLMILGAAYTQIPLFEAAKRLGVRTVAASIPGDWPCFDLADECAFVDISDPEAVAAAAREHAVDGITTCGLDLGMRAVGYTCEKLSLPGPSADAALKASDKYEMKKALAAHGVSTARFFCIRTEEELEAAMLKLPFPVIIKAVDLMGSRGIFRCDTEDEARSSFRKSLEASNKDYCLIEEFIEGELFGTEGMIQNGGICFLLPDNTEAFPGAVPTPVGHSVPFRLENELGEAVIREAEKAVRAIGLDNCPVNIDLIHKDGRVYVVELTGRSGATGLSEMTGLWFGIDYYEMIVRMALGENLKGCFRKTAGCGAVLVRTLMTREKGIVRSIINENDPSDPHIVQIYFNIEPGDEVRPYTNGRDRIGQIIIRGENLENCGHILETAMGRIRIELE